MNRKKFERTLSGYAGPLFSDKYEAPPWIDICIIGCLNVLMLGALFLLKHFFG